MIGLIYRAELLGAAASCLHLAGKATAGAAVRNANVGTTLESTPIQRSAPPFLSHIACSCCCQFYIYWLKYSCRTLCVCVYVRMRVFVSHVVVSGAVVGVVAAL